MAKNQEYFWIISEHGQERSVELLQKLAQDMLNAAVGGRSDEQKRGSSGRPATRALERAAEDLCATSTCLANARHTGRSARGRFLA
jgi:hypothetical protein